MGEFEAKMMLKEIEAMRAAVEALCHGLKGLQEILAHMATSVEEIADWCWAEEEDAPKS